ncbi:MAG: hypothetical protein COU52_03935 [Candidatus Omnitrophica bacterium CG10_big_fil_rev_8_21_14_0_10_43_8]|nr:MAG: hypothetical protein COU52_03935 [Candidatus Omnitrophica bacterium CG10_big_fil_rev_8_21_14_0_10_43_8]
MPNFKYKVRDKYGRPLNGTLGGENKEGVINYLKKMGYTPISVEEYNETFSIKSFLLKFNKVKLEDMIMFTRQLVTLQSAGLPLLMNLSAVKEQTESSVLKNVISQLSLDIEGGSTFADALSRHPNVFDDLYVNMIKSGEISGTLDEVLERLASLAEYQMEIKAKVKSATLYPVIVVITLVVAFLVVVTFVLPRFADLFSRFGVDLPLPTKILLMINYVVRRWWYACIALAGAAVFLFRAYIKTAHGRFAWDNFKIKVPVFGPIMLKISLSRFARVTSSLIKSGIPLLQVLDMASKTTGNSIVERAIDNIKKAVNDGKPMHEPMKIDKLFPPIVTQMVSVGESTGKLDQLLARVSDYYDRQVDYALKNLTTAIEPLLIFCLGGMVLTMALAIFLPLWDMMHVFKG